MNNNPHAIEKSLSNRSKFLVLTSAAVIFIVTVIISLWASYATEQRSFASLTQRSSQQISETVTLATGTLHSMAAAHQASATGFEQTQFAMFAENLLSNQFSITATGRFETLPHEDLDHLKSNLQLHGLFQFEPKSINDEGEIITLESKPQYSTLIAFYPQDPVSANMIGLDFSEIESTKTAIDESLQFNTPVPTEIPERWFSNGQVNLITSTYYGHYIPDSSEDRILQTDGGYFITLNLNEIIAQATGNDFPLGVGISIGSIHESEILADQSASTNQTRSVDGFFPSKSIKHQLKIGSDSATIVYQTPAGVTKAQFTSALVKGMASITLFMIVCAIAAATKASRVQILVNKKALAKERERALVTLNSLQDAVITTDREDNIDYVNPAMLSVLKTSRSELLGLPLEKILQSNFKDEERKTPDTCNNDLKINPINSIKRLVNNSGDPIIFDCNTSAIVDQDSNKIGAVLTMRDISNEHALTTMLAHQATHDALTSLPNRRKFETLLEKILKNKDAKTRNCHIVGYIDLDQFKLINDTVGHAAGDQLLIKLATDLQSFAPENIEIARLGGDEFGFISIGKSKCDAKEVAENFHDFFHTYFYHTSDNTFSIRASIGLTLIKPYHETINDVLSEVDIACYTAKDNGRNGYVIYDAEDLETKKRQGEMFYLPMLQTALKDNRFVLYTQPIVSTSKETGPRSIHHYECLLRLIDEDDNIITPYKFIVAAERYDLIKDIDLWVIENAFSNIAKLKGTQLEETVFSINLSGQSAVDPAMPAFIDSMLKKHEIKSSNICFELTETAVISNFTQAQKLIAFVRNRGSTIALDDFGAGASSFGYLKNLEVDFLKIDGQFVQEMTSNKVDFEMVRSMNSVGEALGIKTIAEFVETEEIMNTLASINVDYAQGYFIGKPSPMADLLRDDKLKTAA